MSATLPPHLVAKANQAHALKELVKKAEIDLEAIAVDMEAWLGQTGNDHGTDASGHVVMKRAGRTVQAFQEKLFKEENPELAKQYTKPRTDAWVAYP